MNKFDEAKEYCDKLWRGKTLYDGHPICVIYEALEIASQITDNPYKKVTVEPFETVDK